MPRLDATCRATRQSVARQTSAEILILAGIDAACTSGDSYSPDSGLFRQTFDHQISTALHDIPARRYSSYVAVPTPSPPSVCSVISLSFLRRPSSTSPRKTLISAKTLSSPAAVFLPTS
jgi:hypothetical protein